MDDSGEITELSSDDDSFDFFKLHGWMMWTAWGLLSLIQIISNRYLKMYWHLNMWVHRINGTIMMLITLIFGFSALKRAGWQEIPGGHNLFGLAVTICVILVALGGVLTRSLANRLWWRSKTIHIFRRVHKVRQNSQFQQILFHPLYSTLPLV